MCIRDSENSVSGSNQAGGFDVFSKALVFHRVVPLYAGIVSDPKRELDTGERNFLNKWLEASSVADTLPVQFVTMTAQGLFDESSHASLRERGTISHFIGRIVSIP